MSRPVRIADLVSQQAESLHQAHLRTIEESGDQEVDEAGPLRQDNRRGLNSKISFVWRSDDRVILDKVRHAVDQAFGELFGDSIRAIDEFYGQMRVPETVDGAIVKDGDGRVVWKKGPSGEEIEDWGQMTGQDIEKALLDIQKTKLILAPHLNDLLLEAVFAKNIAEDAHQEAFAELVEETIPGRNAYAARKSRVDKYHAFYRYYLYSHAEVFMRELNAFSRVLERIRQFRVNDSYNDRQSR